MKKLLGITILGTTLMANLAYAGNCSDKCMEICKSLGISNCENSCQDLIDNVDNIIEDIKNNLHINLPIELETYKNCTQITEFTTEQTTNIEIKPQITTLPQILTTEATTFAITQTPTQSTTEAITETTTLATTQSTTETTTSVTTESTTETTTQVSTENPTKPQINYSYATEVLNLVNKERAKYGLSSLTLNKELNNVAQIKANDMKKNNYFSHTSPTYGTPFEMMNTFGIKYKTAAENIAKGQSSPQQVVNGWMNSEGHRKNILNSAYTQMGLGFSGADSKYWVQMFIG